MPDINVPLLLDNLNEEGKTSVEFGDAVVIKQSNPLICVMDNELVLGVLGVFLNELWFLPTKHFKPNHLRPVKRIIKQNKNFFQESWFIRPLNKVSERMCKLLELDKCCQVHLLH